MALSRRRLDSILLDRAISLGIGLERGVTARAFENGMLRLADGTEITPDHLVLATGKQDLRGTAREAYHGSPTAGLRWRLAASVGMRRLVGHAIELHLFRDGYAGLVLQEEAANLCLAVRQSRLREVGGSPDRLLAALAAECPALEDRLAAALPIGTAQAVARVPYGWIARDSADGVYRVGDQAAVIPSLAGEGIAIALSSGGAAARALGRSQPASAYQRELAMSVRQPVGVAAHLWHLAETRWGSRFITGAVGFAPGAARLIARLTRVC